MTIPADDLAQAQQAIAALKEAALDYTTNRAFTSEYEIAGRRMKFRSMVEVKQLLDFWRTEERRAQRLIDMAAGLPAGNRILTRMGG